MEDCQGMKATDVSRLDLYLHFVGAQVRMKRVSISEVTTASRPGLQREVQKKCRSMPFRFVDRRTHCCLKFVQKSVLNVGVRKLLILMIEAWIVEVDKMKDAPTVSTITCFVLM